MTCRRVIEAAVSCILEEGYHRASSNEIARRAGVTWGAIQYQFGSREGLLVEILSDRWSRLLGSAESAQLPEKVSLEDRLMAVMDVLATHYSSPEYVVLVQITLELVKDPKTSDHVRRAVDLFGVELTAAWRALLEQALGEASWSPELVRYAFRTLRGYLAGNAMASTVADVADDHHDRLLIVRGVAHTIQVEADRLGLSVRI
jgi:AcrR family transcriptional regulator